MIWNILDYFYQSEAWGDPGKMNPMILFLMDKIRGSLPHGCRIKVHCGFASDGHSKNSQHYKGNAVDFHVVGLPFLDAETLIITYLHRKRLIDKVGFGIYPDWNNPGFHLDCRGSRASWGKIETTADYVNYGVALDYAKNKYRGT